MSGWEMRRDKRGVGGGDVWWGVVMGLGKKTMENRPACSDRLTNFRIFSLESRCRLTRLAR